MTMVVKLNSSPGISPTDQTPPWAAPTPAPGRPSPADSSLDLSAFLFQPQKDGQGSAGCGIHGCTGGSATSNIPG